MKAIILSAGQGRRLLPLTETRPKCLLPVSAGTTILGWQLSQLANAGVRQAAVVTGFQADKVEQELHAARPDIAVCTIYNPFFAVADNLGSVWIAQDEMAEDFILLNGDTLFDASVVRRLLEAPPAPITVVVSHKDSYDADDMKVRLDGSRLVDVGKGLDEGQVDGESIGMMLFRGAGVGRFRTATQAAMRREQATRDWYLSVIAGLAQQTAVAVVETPQDEWCEVDFPVDLQRARAAVRRWLARPALLAAAATS